MLRDYSRMLIYSYYMDPKVVHWEPFRTGGELIRIILNARHPTTGIQEVFEIWVMKDVIQDEIGIDRSPTPEDVSVYATAFFEQWMDDVNNNPVFHGAFVTPTSVEYGDYRQFPFSMMESDLDPYIRTNISVPKSLYEWTKVRTVQDSCSLSEIVRRALAEYRNRTDSET